ncbi:hypothetical protein ABBQ38_001619 [Trebouxia sp. C0009 RCD-2024]
MCSASTGKQSSRWEQDLAEVLREPQAGVSREKADKPLQPWQSQKLEEAAAVGRRKVKVNDLAHAVQLPRPEVLAFLKSYVPPTGPSDRNSAPAVEGRSTDAQPAAGHAQPLAPPSTQAAWEGADADQEQQSADPNHQQPRAQPSSPPQPKRMKSKPTVPFADRLRQGSDYEAKRLGRAVEATLERLYEESRRPSDEMLQGFFELHKGVPRRKVIDWFGQRRRRDQVTGQRQQKAR